MRKIEQEYYFSNLEAYVAFVRFLSSVYSLMFPNVIRTLEFLHEK